MSSSGAVTADHQKRSEGSWNQTVGSGKEMLGNMVGAEGLKQEGIRQNQEGKGQEAEGQLSDLGHGTGEYGLILMISCYGRHPSFHLSVTRKRRRNRMVSWQVPLHVCGDRY